jgi:hypothetical protein
MVDDAERICLSCKRLYRNGWEQCIKRALMQKCSNDNLQQKLLPNNAFVATILIKSNPTPIMSLAPAAFAQPPRLRHFRECYTDLANSLSPEMQQMRFVLFPDLHVCPFAREFLTLNAVSETKFDRRRCDGMRLSVLF